MRDSDFVCVCVRVCVCVCVCVCVSGTDTLAPSFLALCHRDAGKKSLVKRLHMVLVEKPLVSKLARFFGPLLRRSKLQHAAWTPPRSDDGAALQVDDRDEAISDAVKEASRTVSTR